MCCYLCMGDNSEGRMTRKTNTNKNKYSLEIDGKRISTERIAEALLNQEYEDQFTVIEFLNDLEFKINKNKEQRDMEVGY